MKKRTKRKSVSAPSRSEPDLSEVLAKIEQHLTFLEKKVDLILGKLAERPAAVPHQAKAPQPAAHQHQHRPDNARQGNDNFRERTLYKAICADCAKECEVPFRPSGDRPVYCKECFGRRKGASPFKPHHDTQPRIVPHPPKEHKEHKAAHLPVNEENKRFIEKKKAAIKKRKKA